MNLIDQLRHMTLRHVHRVLPDDRPPYFCRMHGEPLILDPMLYLWRCPEFAVCGTYVGEEYRARHYTGRATA